MSPGHRKDAPKPLQSEYSLREILITALIQGAVFSGVKALIDRGGARAFQKWTGSGRATERPGPASARRLVRPRVRRRRCSPATHGERDVVAAAGRAPGERTWMVTCAVVLLVSLRSAGRDDRRDDSDAGASHLTAGPRSRPACGADRPTASRTPESRAPGCVPP
ncbi:DUF4235 domain-containing protein [Oerskovia sp. M15]